jgi:orotate phosphoribosyltransferase-like protein
MCRPSAATDAVDITSNDATINSLRIGSSHTFDRRTTYYFYVASDNAVDNNAGRYYSFTTTFDQSLPLIDDIVTTGSTLREASRAVFEVGGEVVGFVVPAETLRRSPPSSHPALSQVEP